MDAAASTRAMLHADRPTRRNNRSSNRHARRPEIRAPIAPAIADLYGRRARRPDTWDRRDDRDLFRRRCSRAAWTAVLAIRSIDDRRRNESDRQRTDGRIR